MAAASSPPPRDRLKFLCSYGGRILPRPPDGHLKYVGGCTRLVAMARPASFSDLKLRLDALLGGGGGGSAAHCIKYQLAADDLDALVSVTGDEDLRHMLDEHDRRSASPSSSRLHIFLFPASLVSSATPPYDATPEQRYVYAINGFPVDPPSAAAAAAHSAPVTLSTASLSANSSPRSSLDFAVPALGGAMRRVYSTPNLGSFEQQRDRTTRCVCCCGVITSYEPRHGRASVVAAGHHLPPPPGRAAAAWCCPCCNSGGVRRLRCGHVADGHWP